MGYTIERGKRVLTLRTEDGRFHGRLGDTLLYVMSASCSNVSPRTYDWEVIAVSYYHEWAGEVMLPRTIWEMGYAADGGGIKPHGKDQPGLAYVKAWKKAVAARYPLLGGDGRPLWYPRASAWVGGYGKDGEEAAARIEAEGEKAFGVRYKHLAPELFASFRRLHPGPVRGGPCHMRLDSLPRLLDAVHLLNHREDLPFSFHLTADENARFLRDPPGERCQP